MIRSITKRDGRLVPFEPETANQWVEWSAGIGVDWSSIILGASRKVFDGCTTDQWHDALISECVDRETTAHLKMGNRLYIGKIYKKTFGSWQAIPTVKDMYHSMVRKGLWVKMDYTDAELDLCQEFIDHNLDLQATLTETKQILDKYAIRDRVDGKYFETPQFVYMRMALGNMEKMPKSRRMEDVFWIYKYWSEKKINPPSPFQTNLGTPKRQYASCCTFTTKDTIPSLAAADHIAYVMTAASAGIGSHIASRSKGDKVRGGAIIHQGKLPYYVMQEKAVAANKQGSRGGANTMHFTCLDPELDDLLKLKNVQTVADKRIKDIDYSFGVNPYIAYKAARNLDWMLVSYAHAPKLYELFYSPNLGEFIAEYERVFADPSIPKKLVNARHAAIMIFLIEAVGTGRLYEHNAHELNRHTPFKETIHSSNLCQEIGLVTKGYENVAELYQYAEGTGEIGLCSLSAIAAGLVADDEYERVAYYAALSIDNVIEIMEYPFPQLEYTAKRRRSIGVGITNLAYAMAKAGLKYSTLEGKQFIHRLAERHSFWLHMASVRLAQERGACEWMNRTKYADGWLPIDTANKKIREIIGQALLCDWEGLRKLILKYGVRFSVLEAHMPCESSAVAGGHTNGIYPIRAYLVVKTSGTNKTLFIAPELDTLKDFYELAWDIPTRDMIEVYAIIQCFTGQAISADLYLKIERIEQEDGRKVPIVSGKELFEDWLYRIELGLKTRYYINSKTNAELEEVKAAITQHEVQEEVCDTCSL